MLVPETYAGERANARRLRGESRYQSQLVGASIVAASPSSPTIRCSQHRRFRFRAQRRGRLRGHEAAPSSVCFPNYVPVTATGGARGSGEKSLPRVCGHTRHWGAGHHHSGRPHERQAVSSTIVRAGRTACFIDVMETRPGAKYDWISEPRIDEQGKRSPGDVHLW
jgi:hypothetical protein